MPLFETRRLRKFPLTPEEREAELDQPTDLYYHRDGTKAKTRREGMEIFKNLHARKRGNRDFFRVAQTVFPRRGRLSTVFLVLDHSLGMDGNPPLIFETMLFPNTPWADQGQWRYSTEAQAKQGHRRIVRAIRVIFAYNVVARILGLEPRQFNVWEFNPYGDDDAAAR